MSSVNQIRQGDVYLKRVTAIPEGLESVRPGGIGYVLEEGEVTGHFHAISKTDFMKMWKGSDTDFNELFIDVDKPVDLTHDEHGTAKIPAGLWRKITQRQYAPDSIQKVID